MFQNVLNKSKPAKIQSALPQKIGKIVLWGLIAFLILRGIGSVLKKDPSKDIDKKLNSGFVSLEDKSKIESQASAYAVSFAKEFLTYSAGDTEDYRKRVTKYLPQYLVSQIPNILTSSDVQAMNLVAISDDFYTETQINVDVKASVLYLDKVKDQNGNIVDSKVIKDIYLRIPIATKSGKYVVEDIPAFIAKPNNADIASNAFYGTSVDSNISGEIEKMLNNFLKTYCEGNDSEIAYYMGSSQNEIHGLGGSFKFLNINDLKVYAGQNVNQNIVLVTYSVQDTNSKQEIKQKLNIETIKKDDRYYINNFDVRTGNLKDGGSKK